MLAVTSLKKNCLHLSEFNYGDWENLEKLRGMCVAGRLTQLACLPVTNFSCKTRYIVRRPLCMSLLTGRVFGLHGRHSRCTYLLSLLRSQQEENKIKMSRKMALLRTLNVFSSSLLALG